jgi:site-specific recombinase XerD
VPRSLSCSVSGFPYDVALSQIVPYRPRKPTNLAEAGIDLVTLAAMLGHSKINLVLRYTHPKQEHHTKATEMMERFVASQQIDAAAKRQGMLEMAIQ